MIKAFIKLFFPEYYAKLSILLCDWRILKTYYGYLSLPSMAARRLSGRPHRIKVFFGPEFPTIFSLERKLMAIDPFQIVLSPERSDVIFYREDKTKSENIIKYHDPHSIQINFEGRDIGKRTVAKVHLNAFGYTHEIDPLTFYGNIVVKSDDNATHDGEVLTGPLEISDLDASKAYSILIDNRDQANEKFVVDLRVVMIFHKPIILFRKFRSIECRFTDSNSFADVKNCDDFFSHTELEKLGQFTKMMGLEFCAIDVLRDRGTGRIYVVDVNKTPWGPPKVLSTQEAKQALELISQALASEITRLLQFANPIKT